ncbi:MAG TPA: AI-2E family transporter [Chloroflexota bacterium]|nr:AI-2E family transporter [Chloroflexota bacterium]
MPALPDESDRRPRGGSPIPASWQRALYLPLIILAWLAVVVIAGWLLTHIGKTILVLVLSGIVAYALTPVVTFLSRRMPRWLAIALAYVLGFSILLGLGAILVDTAASQITNLVGHLPKYEQQLKRFEPRMASALSPLGVTQAKIDHTEQQAVAYLQGAGTGVASQSISIVSGVLNTLIDIILILILSVYLTANGPKIAKRLRRETPLTQRWRTALIITIVNQVVGGYIRGTLAMATLIGILVGGGMLVLQIPYAILLGLLAFFMEFIPIIGVLISGAVCVVVALFKGWVLAVIVLAYFVVVHIIEGDIVGPRVMGKAVGIHPATALIGLVAGTEIFGIWGALFAAPLAGLLQAIGTAAWRESRGSEPPAVVQAVVAKEKLDTPGLPTEHGA